MNITVILMSIVTLGVTNLWTNIYGAQSKPRTLNFQPEVTVQEMQPLSPRPPATTTPPATTVTYDTSTTCVTKLWAACLFGSCTLIGVCIYLLITMKTQGKLP